MKHSIVFFAIVLSAPAHSAPTSKWEYSNSTDAMTDVSSYSASKRGDAGLLSISCKRGDQNSITVLAGSDKPVGGSRVAMRDLTYRLDDAQPVQGPWVYHGRAAMLTDTPSSSKLLIPMMNASRLLVRMDAYDGSTDIKFEVSGAADVVRQLMASCQIR